MHKLIALILLGAAVTVQAATLRIDTLPADAVALDLPPVALEQPQQALAIALPGQRAIRFTTTLEHPAPGLVGVRGRSAGSDRLMLFRSGSGLSGSVNASGAQFRLVRHDERYWWVDPHTAGERAPPGDWELPRGPASIPVSAASPAPIQAPDAQGHYEVDLLVVYTPLYEERLGGPAGANDEAQRLVFSANTYFETSGVPVRYRLLGAEKYTGTREDVSLRRNLGVTVRDPAVKAYRDRIGADLVIHLRASGCTGNVGLSQGFNGFEQSDPPGDVVPDRDGFAAAAMGPAEDGTQCPDWVFAHELGHNLAAGHHWSQHTADNIYWKPYAHGWQCGVAGAGVTYFSIMSYTAVSLETHGDFFSSPGVMLDGMPCGTQGMPLEAVHADNARVMTEAAPYVAAYKTRRVP